MNTLQAREIIDVMKSIDEKLGRVADALEKHVGGYVDLSGVLDEVVAAEKQESVVEEWDDERILEQFRNIHWARRGFVLTPQDTAVITARDCTSHGVVEIRVDNVYVGTVRTLIYDYINDTIL